MWWCSAWTSIPLGAWIAPNASDTPTTLAPRSATIRAAHEPTLPKPWMTTRVSASSRPSAGAASCRQMTTPRPVAASRPSEPPSEIGLPVTIAGVWPCSLPYSSIIQAITWAFVFTSGAGMSRVGPSTFSILSMKDRVIFCTSSRLSSVGSQFTPPLAPPKGMPTIAVFHDISAARARTSSRSTSGWKRTPPLYGPRAPLCWTR